MHFSARLVASWVAAAGLALAVILAIALSTSGTVASAQSQSCPAAVPGACRAGVDMQGGDFLSFELPASSPALCAAACLQHGRCTHYTFKRPGAYAPAPNSATCWLREGAIDLVNADECCISGEISFADRHPATVTPVPTGRARFSGAIDQRGVRPLLLVIGQYRDGDGTYLPVGQPNIVNGRNLLDSRGRARPINPAWVLPRQTEQFVFGPAEPNVGAYFYESSNGLFTFFKAGVIVADAGLWDLPLVVNNEEWRVPLSLAIRSGFDFTPYDRNSDGMVSPNELTILYFSNSNMASGGNREAPRDFPCQSAGATATPRYAPANPTLTICPSVAAVGLLSDFENVTHEVSHSVGTIDQYGQPAGSCWNQLFTSMSCTIGMRGGGPNAFVTRHLDPWHRIALGWTSPIYLSTQRVALEPFSAALAAPQSGQERPIVLFDESGQRDEYFILEWRSPTAGRAGPGIASAANVQYDSGVGGAGLVPWHVMHAPGRPSVWRAVAGQILPGANGRFDTIIDSRDVLVDVNDDGAGDYVHPGSDGVMHSSPRSDDSAVFHEPPNVTFDPAAGRAGSCAPYGAGMGVELRWSDGASTMVSANVEDATPDGSLGNVALTRATPINQTQALAVGAGREIGSRASGWADAGANCGLNRAASTLATCESMCLRDPGCGAYTFNGPGPGAAPNVWGVCSIKQASGGLVAATARTTSGTVQWSSGSVVRP